MKGVLEAGHLRRLGQNIKLDALKKHIRIEETNKPWFGPRKRARQYLLHRRQVLESSQALDMLLHLLGSRAEAVQQVRFIDFVHKKEQNFRYTIIVVWTYSDPIARQAIYEISEQMVLETGWYPLLQGERLKSQLAAKLDWEKSTSNYIQKPISGISGPMISVASAVRSNGGCSLRVNLAKGAILLDLGLPSYLSPKPEDKLSLLSHIHQDHSGGIEALRKSNIPILMSPVSGQLLLDHNSLQRDDINKTIFYIVPDHSWISIGTGIEVTAFLIPHAPGSLGYLLRDEKTALLYTGDIVCRTYRHDFTPNMLKWFRETARPNNWLLLDATMAGRSMGATTVDAASALFATVNDSSDVIIVARDPEQLLFAYLDIFAYAKQHQHWRHGVSYFLTSKLRPIFRLLHSAFMTRKMKEIDPFIIAQYGASMSAWGESRWLYWLHKKSLKLVTDSQGLRIWFLTINDEEVYHGGINPLIAAIGSIDEFEVTKKFKGVPMNLSTMPWTLHSNGDNLLEVIRLLHPSAKILLFHNFPKRLKQFVRKSNLDCEIVSSNSVYLQ